MTEDDFRHLALALPEAQEGAHMNHPDFRVRGKVFATLWPADSRGVVMLTPEQQAMLVAAEPAMFTPVPGGWGRMGATNVMLANGDPASVRSALMMAWRNKAPRSLASPP